MSRTYPFNDPEAETLQVCQFCRKEFLELKTYSDHQVLVGAYLPVCIDCDGLAQTRVRPLTKDGENAINPQ